MSLWATVDINPDYASETLVNVYDGDKLDSDGSPLLLCWGGGNLMTGERYHVYTPSYAPRFSVKQEGLFRAFLDAAHIMFCIHGDTEWRPKSPFECFKVLEWARGSRFERAA